jgi:hypothetical protein
MSEAVALNWAGFRARRTDYQHRESPSVTDVSLELNFIDSSSWSASPSLGASPRRAIAAVRKGGQMLKLSTRPILICRV